jgi:hypothetical protein
VTGWTVERRYRGRADRVVVRARKGLGSPVVLKSTRPGATWRERATLRREGRLLERVAGFGVVDLLDVADTRGRTTLVLGFVPLSSPPEVDLRPVVERLARLDVCHGQLTPDHVLLTADGEPVLCGFGQTSSRSRSSSVSRRTTSRASPSFTKTTGGRGTLL